MGTEVGMRIMIVLPSFRGGGAERVFIRLAGALSERGHEVILAVGQARGELERLVSNEIEVVDLQASRMAASTFKIASLIRAREPDVVLSALMAANIAAGLAHRLARRPRSALVLSERSLPWLEAPSSPIKARMFKGLARLSYGRATRVIGVSEQVSRATIEKLGVRPDAATAISNPAPRAEGEIRPVDHPWLAADRDWKVAIAVGRLVPQKDFATLIRAIRRARETSDVRLVILGEGPLRSDLLDEAGDRADEFLSMPGFTDNVRGWLSGGDLFALSSRVEGMPNAMIEAMAEGMRIVSTRTPGGPMELLKDGELAPVAELGDDKEMARLILDALGRPAPGANAYHMARYDEGSIFAQYEEVLRAAVRQAAHS